MASTEKVETIALFLTHEEAEALAVVLCRIAGDPKTTPRRLTDSISNALHKAGVHWHKSDMFKSLANGPSLTWTTNKGKYPGY
jgi:hypothetical protein